MFLLLALIVIMDHWQTITDRLKNQFAVEANLIKSLLLNYMLGLPQRRLYHLVTIWAVKGAHGSAEGQTCTAKYGSVKPAVKQSTYTSGVYCNGTMTPQLYT